MAAPANIVIISAGKFAREVYSWVKHAISAGKPWRIKGFLDSRANQLAGFNYPVPILASVEAYEPSTDDLFLCPIGSPTDRRRYTEMIQSKGGRFATLIHPAAILGDNVVLGEGVIIAPQALLTCDLALGDSVYIGPFSSCGHDNQIAAWCQVSGHCSLGGNVAVEEECFLGMRSVVNPGVRIGRGAHVGVGSVVLRNVPAGTTVFGNPAAPIRLPRFQCAS